MNSRKLTIITVLVAVVGFAFAAFLFNQGGKEQVAVQEEFLVQPYSPVLGWEKAPVTIVEFFDPACETCRAFHPIVKEIKKQFPTKVRVVLRYAPFHPGSDEVIRMLEAARIQKVFEPVLEALLEAQPMWASHGSPNLDNAWAAATNAGLDVSKAKRDMMLSEITNVLNQEMADIRALGVRQTPTFFVNGKPLPSFGAQQLTDLVQSEVNALR